MLRRTFIQSITFAASLLGLKENPPKNAEEYIAAISGPIYHPCSWCGMNVPPNASHSCTSKEADEQYYFECGVSVAEQRRLKKHRNKSI